MRLQTPARDFDRLFYGAIAAVFGLAVFIGFSRTYYLQTLLAGPPIPSITVHLHGIVMTAWVLLFLSQVTLISARRVRLHQQLGYAGIGLAVLIVVIGVRTALAAARYGTASTPEGFSQPTFLIVPLGDMVLFTLLFGGAVYYRKNPGRHKGLMLLTVATFLPPALARVPSEFVHQNPILFGAGVPTGIALVGLALNWLKRRRMDWVLAVATVILIASFPLRIAFMTTPIWGSTSAWLATLVN